MSGDGRFKRIAIAICENRAYGRPTYLGAGAFKEAYLTTIENSVPAALKIFDPAKCDLCRAEREISAMMRFTSPRVGKLYDWDVHSSASADVLFVVEEYLAGGTLSARLASREPRLEDIYNYGLPLVQAIVQLKEMSLVHRDIKPDNIMFRSDSDDSPVLVDFGLVRDLTGESLTGTHLQQGPGTPFFASPEQLNNEKELIDWRADQFSLGVVLAMCLTGSHPYAEAGMQCPQVVGRVMARSVRSNSFARKASASGCSFLIKMVSPWPVERYARPENLIYAFEEFKGRIGL